MTKDEKTTVVRIVAPAMIVLIAAFAWVAFQAMKLEDQLAGCEAKAEVEQVQTNDTQEVEDSSNPLGIGDDVLITIAGVITNATPDEVAAAHDLIVHTISEKLGTNGLKVVYVEFR